MWDWKGAVGLIRRAAAGALLLPKKCRIMPPEPPHVSYEATAWASSVGAGNLHPCMHFIPQRCQVR